jgi:hypothetical protein
VLEGKDARKIDEALAGVLYAAPTEFIDKRSGS